MLYHHFDKRAVSSLWRPLALFLGAGLLSSVPAWATGPVLSATTGQRIEAEARRFMQENSIPGLSVAITIDGRRRIFNEGVASRESGEPVTDKTLFEIGAIGETFAGLLASYAQVKGRLSFFDEVSDHLLSLKGSAFDTVTVLNLATHTSGLDLFPPEDVKTPEALLAYCAPWRRRYAPGSQRTYSHIGAALLATVGAAAMKQDYDELLGRKILPKLGLSHTYTQVPASSTIDYAQGYTQGDLPVHIGPEPLASAVYGMRTTAGDMIRYVEAHMEAGDIDPDMKRAIRKTLTGYYKAGPFTQNLIWEQYAFPVVLRQLVQGNSTTVEWTDVPALRLKPPFPPRRNVWINKVGSTRGFAAYVAFVPASKTGVALLVNKSIPEPDLVSTAYRILEMLQSRSP
ncbi:serine hydrolase [Nitratireductor aquibiodomus]|jgi:beta-lactamase class C|uniref:serine hydrolase n=1 Tax=Nitratireductor aquibiodomus TaxID=204799 RepID=UPI000B7C9817|nr:serine hydrolase [Nitratireductor aquibiodomus]